MDADQQKEEKAAKNQARKERQEKIFMEKCKKDVFDVYDANRIFYKLKY